MPLSTKAALCKDNRTTGTMQHRHFATIARVINRLHTRKPDRLTSGMVASFFADALAETNPRFDRERFLRACGTRWPD